MHVVDELIYLYTKLETFSNNIMSSQNENVKVILVSSTTRRGIYLPTDISYLNLLTKVRNKFDLDMDAGYSLCYKLSLNDDPMEITDDEEVNFFIEAARNVDGKPLELLVHQSSIGQQNDHVHFPTTYLPISQHSNLHPHLHDHSSQYHNSSQYHQSSQYHHSYNIDGQYKNPNEQETWKQYLNAPLFSSPPPYQNAPFNSQVNLPIFHNFFENEDNETQKYCKQVFQDNHDVQHYTSVPDTYDVGTSQKWSFDVGDGMEDNAESEEEIEEEMGGKSGEENEQGSDGDEDNIKFKYILPTDWQKKTFCHMPKPKATPSSDIKQKKPKSSSKTIIWEGQWFLNKKDCKKTISLKSMDDGYEYKVRKSDKKRYDVICVNEGCPWKILTHGAIDGPGFHVTTVHDHHTCSKTEVKPKHRNATKEVLGDILMEQLRDPNRVYKPKDIVHDIGANFQVDITYLQAWRGKANALEKLMGTHEESFSKLPCYLHNLKVKNPGSFTDIKTDNYGRFEMCFVAIGAVIRSFVNHLRPLIIVDGAHLKGKYIGSNLVAVAMDGDNKIVPLAYGVSPGEAGAAWSWFFTK